MSLIVTMSMAACTQVALLMRRQAAPCCSMLVRGLLLQGWQWGPELVVYSNVLHAVRHLVAMPLCMQCQWSDSCHWTTDCPCPVCSHHVAALTGSLAPLGHEAGLTIGFMDH